MKEETALMRRAAEGDSRAYSEIVARYWERILRVSFLLLHDAGEAEEVAQETFVRGLDRAAAFRGDGDPARWFYAIALNLCRRRWRDHRRHASSASISRLDGQRPRGFAPHGVLTSLVRRESRVRLQLAIAGLEDRQREAFVLHYVEELPYDDIGRILGLTAGAARVLSYRARESLRATLGEDV